jgi:hypothetical protein
MTGDALSVAWQVEGGAIFPISPKDCTDAATAATGPGRVCQSRVGRKIPATSGWRVLWIARAVESQRVGASISRHDANEHVRPRDLIQLPTPFGCCQQECCLREICSKCPLVRSTHGTWLPPLTRSLGTKSKDTLHDGQVVSVPTWVPGLGRSWVPAICRTCSVASAGLRPNSYSAAQCFTFETVELGLKERLAVLPL